MVEEMKTWDDAVLGVGCPLTLSIAAVSIAEQGTLVSRDLRATWEDSRRLVTRVLAVPL